MLILTRRIGEKLIINEEISVVVIEIKGNQVRFGIDAPKYITVDREEVHQKRIKNPLYRKPEIPPLSVNKAVSKSLDAL